MNKMKALTKGMIFGFYNSVITYFPSFTIRHFYLRKIIRVTIGKCSSVGIGCFITGRNISIGNNCVINRFCLLDGRAGIEIGNNVSISPNVSVVSLSHDKDDPQFRTVSKPVIIRDYVWIGIHALILPGVIVEKGAVVGAGAVVVKNVNEFAVVAGNPAEVISKRNKNLTYNLKYFPIFNSDETL